MLGLSGCALIPKPLKWAKVTPVTSPQTVSPADGFYEASKTAIDRRDYAAALDLLQKARAARADDVRVLNAFGVVYDKLGRFDLSARYYAQATALDPASAVVNHNVAYSQLLQTRTFDNGRTITADAAPAPSPAPTVMLAEAPPQPTMVPRLVAAGPHVLRPRIADRSRDRTPRPSSTWTRFYWRSNPSLPSPPRPDSPC